MPTYSFWSRAGLLAPEQRARIARAVTEIHHEAGRAPRYFVQVIFNVLTPRSHFIAGDDAPRDQIWVRADIRAGRTPEQKREIMTRIIAETSAIADVSGENIWVYISDIPGEAVAEFGEILPNPGEEAAWFAALPVALQEKLRPLA